MTRPNPARVLNARDAQIARETLARAAVVDAAVAVTDQGWFRVSTDPNNSLDFNTELRKVAFAVHALRALQGENAP